ncbi:hypothetical protein F4825DRAFT_449390 [Nemania diffusa]|nr:hypothetical protein F4825DRAFT_449390 [Nemania diffusa]
MVASFSACLLNGASTVGKVCLETSSRAPAVELEGNTHLLEGTWDDETLYYWANGAKVGSTYILHPIRYDYNVITS